MLELSQYYVTASTLVGLDTHTSEIVRIKPRADATVELDGTRDIIVGAFVRFDPKTRILHTESGVQLYLPAAAAEKSRFLKDTTKRWLSSLS